MFSGVIVAKGGGGIGDEVSGDTTTFDVQTILEAFLDMSERPVRYADEVFSGKKRNFLAWGLLSSSAGLSGFLNYQALH